MGTAAFQKPPTVGHTPDSMAEVLYQPLLDGNIYIKCKISGQSRSALEGVWLQGGGIEIPCMYNVFVKKELKDLMKSLKEKLCSLKHNADGTV